MGPPDADATLPDEVPGVLERNSNDSPSADSGTPDGDPDPDEGPPPVRRPERDDAPRDIPEALQRQRERRGLVYGFLFGLVIFGGVFLYLRVGLPALLFVGACFAGMLFFSKV